MSRKRKTRTPGLGDLKGFTPATRKPLLFAPIRPHAVATELCEQFGKATAGRKSRRRQPDRTRTYPAAKPWGLGLNRMNREEARDCAIALAIKVDLGTEFPRNEPQPVRAPGSSFTVERRGGKRLNAKQLARARLTEAELEAKLQRLPAKGERASLNKALAQPSPSRVRLVAKLRPGD